MATQILRFHKDNPEPRIIRQASDLLRDGFIIALPTETGYCFVGDAQKESTHQQFLSLRPQHPSKKPFSLLCRDITQMSGCAILTTTVFRIATKVLPGPYTFVLECSRATPKVAAGPKRKQVGVRVSSLKVAKTLVDCFGSPLLITSVTDQAELEDFFEEETHDQDAWWTNGDAIASRFSTNLGAVLDCATQFPMRGSTVIDFTQTPPTILRDGGWDKDVLGILS